MNFTLLRYPSISSMILYCLSLFMGSMAMKYLLYNKTTILMWEITIIFSSPMTFPVILDPVGLTFSTIVLFISANVMMFANTYMEGDPYLNRFILLVNAFVLSMNMLIFFPHLFTLLLGWDGLGLTSFLLIIYYQNAKSLGGGLLTALTNRIGDAFILMAIALMLNQNHWIIINIWDPQPMLLTALILLAAMTKSAQIPFSSWLPAAMAAPTPVSALVHSSTLVTAGVFLLIRFYPMLHLMTWFNPSLLIVSCFTMIMAGMSAMVECDLKKIIALSTLSQLGVMMTSLGLGYVSLALFHLMTHALFKALLFLCAGNVIHVHLHNQDLRTVGNLTNQMPISSSCFIIANLALCGAPFLAGFYSKDSILELSIWYPLNMLILTLIFFGTMLTAMYSARFFVYLLISPNFFSPFININEEDNKSTVPISILTMGAIMGGAFMFWLFFPFNLSPVLPLNMKLFTIFMISLSILLTLPNLTENTINKAPTMKMKMMFFAHSYMWFLTPLSTQSIMNQPMKMSHNFLKILDQSWIEVLSSQSGHISSTSSAKLAQLLQKNTINSFLFMSLMIIPLYVFMFL
uniref:NADH-ubiquinone oxidoreductase chain 5 n=1 Tax=Clymenella torquata TaxID=292503 RepID=Q642W7_CLYTO